MVLENSTSSPPTESFGSVSASENDSYASADEEGSENVREYIVSMASFRPPPIFGRLSGVNDKVYDELLRMKLERAHELIKRPLTEEEVNVLAYHTGRSLTISSYSSVAGIAAGLYRSYATSRTFKFPFWQPNPEKFNANVFPSAKAAILTGPRAITAWHLTRYNAYVFVSLYISRFIFGSYAFTVDLVAIARDPRLKHLNPALMKARKEPVNRQRGESEGIPRSPGRPGQMQGQPKNMSKDDASPTGGVPFYGEQTSNTEPSESADWPQAATSTSPQTRMALRTTSIPAQHQETDQGAFDMFGDGASPTGGQGMNENMSSMSQNKSSGGSAWDRIRRGEKPDAQGKKPQQFGWGKRQVNKQKEQREGSTSGDSFTFSETEQDRSLAQVEAQKDFDARVDKERRGGDFSSESGEKKRW